MLRFKAKSCARPLGSALCYDSRLGLMLGFRARIKGSYKVTIMLASVLVFFSEG